MLKITDYDDYYSGLSLYVKHRCMIYISLTGRCKIQIKVGRHMEEYCGRSLLNHVCFRNRENVKGYHRVYRVKYAALFHKNQLTDEYIPRLYKKMIKFTLMYNIT